MYASIHTHIESDKDTANMISDALLEFERSGCKKFVVTEHGTMSSYEDLKSTVAAINKERAGTGEAPMDIDIIPGCELYFDLTDYLSKLKDTHPDLFQNEEFDLEDKSKHKRAHLIVGAKDYEGYLSLCKLITAANKNAYVQKLSTTQNIVYPLTTIDMLKEYIKDGHVFATSACIAGPFGMLLGLDYENVKERYTSQKKILSDSGYDYDKAKEAEEELHYYEDLYNSIKPSKEEEAAAKEAKDKELQAKLRENRKRATEIKKSEGYVDANNAIKANTKFIKTNKLTRTLNNVIRLEQHLKEETEKLQGGYNTQKASYLLKDFEDVFGKDDFFFELQNHGIPKEKVVYNNIVKFAFTHDHARFIASNDIHVAMQKDNPEYQNALLRRNMIQFTRFKNYMPMEDDFSEYCIKNDEELSKELLKTIQPLTKTENGEEKVIVSSEDIVANAMSNIKAVVDECKIVEPKQENHYPKFCDNAEEEFERQVREGLKKKFPNGFPSPVYEERIEKELKIIKSMGYASYLLIVNDYLSYGRLLGYLPDDEIENAPLSIKELDKYITEKGYPRVGYRIGPGRGSAAGSLACYGMGITDLDPIPYDLLFERFLNPERKSMPDIDCDFSPNIRNKVIEYCRAKYGDECICQIMTKSYGKAKGNIRLAGRYLAAKECNDLHLSSSTEKDEISKKWYKRADKICKQITKEDENTILQNAENFIDLEDEEIETQDASTNDYSEVDENALDNSEKKILALAKALQAPFTQFGEHAAGVIISKDRLTDIIPLMYNANKDNMSTQCNMAQAEAKGLLKMDFLGLKNLDIITRIIQTPTDKRDIDDRLQDYEERTKVINDKSIYRDIYAATMVQGIFQFESPGMKKTLKSINPTCFEDIIAAISLYRPGPMDYIPQFVVNKKACELAERITKLTNSLDNQELSTEQADVILQGIIKEAVNTYVSNAEIKQIGGIESYTKLHRLDIYENTKHFDAAKISKIKDILLDTKEAPYLGSPILKEILEPTYGVITYQEQVMLIFQKLAGYTLGQADAVRKAISKKHTDEILAEKEAFIYGDESRGIKGVIHQTDLTEEQATNLFETMKKFGEYAFNKSHAAAYALVSLFTAYCKKYHTADFYKESLNAMEDQKDIFKYASEMKAFGLRLAPPSLEYSENEFTLSKDKKTIYCGLKYIKGASSVEINRTTCLEDFVYKNPQISDKLLLNYAKLGMFKTVFGTDTKLASREDCISWIKNLLPSFKATLSYIKENQTILEKERNGEPYPIEEKRKLKEAFQAEKLSYMNLKKEFVSIQDDKAQNFEYERELLGTVLSAEDSLSLLANEKYDFSTLKDAGVPQMIGAMVISTTEKKSKKGFTYYEVALMDKTGATDIFHLTQKPQYLFARYKLQPSGGEYFSEEKAPIKSMKSKGQVIPFQNIRQDINNGTFHPDNICALECTHVPGGETMIYAKMEGDDNGREL